MPLRQLGFIERSRRRFSLTKPLMRFCPARPARRVQHHDGAGERAGGIRVLMQLVRHQGPEIGRRMLPHIGIVAAKRRQTGKLRAARIVHRASLS